MQMCVRACVHARVHACVCALYNNGVALDGCHPEAEHQGQCHSSLMQECFGSRYGSGVETMSKELCML